MKMRKRPDPYQGEVDITKMTKQEMNEFLSKTSIVQKLSMRLSYAKDALAENVIMNRKYKSQIAQLMSCLHYFRDKYEQDNSDAKYLLGRYKNPNENADD